MQYVVFLRAINVASRRIKMADLREAFIDGGYSDVSTYIASGNVIFSATAIPERQAIEALVQERFGFESEAFIRSGAELSSIVSHVPWNSDNNSIEVSFLERATSASDARVLEATVQEPEALVVRGSVVYFRRQGKDIETVHKESTSARILGQTMTRRGFTTVRMINDKFFGPHSDTAS